MGKERRVWGISQTLVEKTGNTQETPNQERAATKQDATPTDQKPSHQEEEAATLPQHNKTQAQQVKTNIQHMASPIQNNGATKFTYVNPEFLHQHQENRQTF